MKLKCYETITRNRFGLGFIHEHGGPTRPPTMNASRGYGGLWVEFVVDYCLSPGAQAKNGKAKHDGQIFLRLKKENVS